MMISMNDITRSSHCTGWGIRNTCNSNIVHLMWRLQPRPRPRASSGWSSSRCRRTCGPPRPRPAGTQRCKMPPRNCWCPPDPLPPPAHHQNIFRIKQKIFLASNKNILAITQILLFLKYFHSTFLFYAYCCNSFVNVDIYHGGLLRAGSIDDEAAQRRSEEG